MRWGSALVSQDEKEQRWSILLPLPPEWDGNGGGGRLGKVRECLTQELNLSASRLVGILTTLLSVSLGSSLDPALFLWLKPSECGILLGVFTCSGFHVFEISGVAETRLLKNPSNALFLCRVGVVVGINELGSVWL